MRVVRNWLISSSLLLIVCFCCFSLEEKEFCSDDQMATTTLGGLKDSNCDSNSNSNDDSSIHNLALFAVNEHNTKNNGILELVRVVKSEEQVVAGTLYHLTLEVADAGGSNKIYSAKIWVKPWLNFKELQEFTHIPPSNPQFTKSDLGAKKDDQDSGWKSVPVHDPVVQDAANHAVTTIQQRSNSLFPYQLTHIVHANAQVHHHDASATFDMLLNLNRGDKQEKFKVQVHRDPQGAFRLNQMEQDHS